MGHKPAGTAMSKVRRLVHAVAILVPAAAFCTPMSVTIAAEKSTLLTEVHFDSGSTDVTIGGQKKIEQAIEAIRAGNPREIRVIGFTDSTGDAENNRAISRNRADNVASLLAKQGVTARLVIEGKGEDGAPYEIPDNTSEPLNRCVGIIAVGEGASKPEPML